MSFRHSSLCVFYSNAFVLFPTFLPFPFCWCPNWQPNPIRIGDARNLRLSFLFFVCQKEKGLVTGGIRPCLIIKSRRKLTFGCQLRWAWANGRMRREESRTSSFVFYLSCGLLTTSPLNTVDGHSSSSASLSTSPNISAYVGLLRRPLRKLVERLHRYVTSSFC
jgi:hypothetical protein